MAYQLHITNKNYSSWSLRPWLVLKWAKIPFEEREIQLAQPGYGEHAIEEVLRVSPNGRVPALHANTLVIWDSLAIAEYLAELHDGVWPKDGAVRAWARCVAAEMHSSFAVLRERCSMNCGLRVVLNEMPEAIIKDIARVNEIWGEGVKRFDGPFLAGRAFTAADAFYAPVAFRVQTYGLTLDPAAHGYAQRLLDLPSMRAWYAAALAETFRDEHDEVTIRYGKITQDLRAKVG